MSATPPHGVSLQALLAGLASAPPVSVAGLRLDGRDLRPGEAFVALQGLSAHGLDFVTQALAAGAVAVLYDPAEAASPSLPASVVAVAVPALKDHLGTIAGRCYGEAATRLSIAGITGTNGKTTCAWLLADASTRLEERAGYLGTLGAGFPPGLSGTSHTTPDVLSVHRLLAGLAEGGAVRAALEVSSHALDQKRLAGLRLGIAAFTNLTRDHLDYHGTEEAYAAAKQRIFSLPGVTRAVVNVGDAAGRRYAASLPAGVELVAVAVGDVAMPEGERYVQVTSVEAAATGLVLGLRGDFGERELRSRLVGSFNAENLAIVLGVLRAWGHGVDEALGALAEATAPPGRMEGFRLPGGALAIVDYAHTPDALSKVLESARQHVDGRLRVVFGCGGDRDRGKRAPMGEIAERLADEVFVTDDNPRNEDPEHIVAMILGGMRAPGQAHVLRDRASAIAEALAGTREGDIVVIAGKGHEDYQLVGGERRRFSDRDCVARHAGRAA